MKIIPFNSDEPQNSQTDQKKSTNEKHDSELKEACQAFESLLWEKVFESGRKASFKKILSEDEGEKSLVGNDDSDNSYYEEMMDQQMATKMAQDDKTGLANILYQQLKGRE